MQGSSSVETSGSSIWKTSLDWDRRFNASTNSGEVAIAGEAGIADGRYLADLVKSSNAGSAQLTGLAKQWESTHRNAVRMLMEELDALNAQKDEAEKKRRRILNDDVFLKLDTAEARRSFVEPWLMDEEQEEDLCSSSGSLPSLEDCYEEDESHSYWKSKAMELNRLLRESLNREAVLSQKLRRKFDETVNDLQRHLERVDNFLHFILRNSPVILYHQDKELRYRFIYNQVPSIQSEIIGKTDLEIYKGKNSQETVDFKKEVLRRGEPARREFVYEDESCGVKAFLLCCEPVFSRSGEVIGINGVSIDISEEFHSREQIVVMREEAAVRRTLELELQKTMRISEETMKSKQLLAKMSHEIRSPLAVVVSTAEMLSSTSLDCQQRMLIDTMVDSGEMVMQLINDILDLSKAESGAMKLDCTKFRPREVLKGVLQTAAASPYVRNKPELALEGLVCDVVPVELSGDVLKLRQILTNLVSNASKFTQEGSVKVTVRVVEDAHQPADGTIRLEYEVSDTGIGIPEAALPFLFNKYMQASVTHARDYGGTGLGLAICKELVELMGGDLRVASKEGQGSTFTFTVRTRFIEGCETCPSDSTTSSRFKFYPIAVSPEQSRPPEAGPCSKNGDWTGLKILLAEDNKVNVMLAQSMLKKLGLEAKVVINGAEAVQAVRQDYYDLVLMDVCMPVMNGVEATRLIRAEEKSSSGERRRTSIVAFTANALQDSIDECLANGMDSFIAKPVTFSKLQQVIQQFLPSTTQRYSANSTDGDLAVSRMRGSSDSYQSSELNDIHGGQLQANFTGG